MAKTIAGAVQIAYGLEKISEQDWQSAANFANGVFTFVVPIEITDYLTIGTRTGTAGLYSVAIGERCEASGYGSVAVGSNNTASNMYSHAEGENNNATGRNSHAEGSNTDAVGGDSHAEGFYSEARGGCSHAEGDTAQAFGRGSHAEGSLTQARGDSSHAEGVATYANGDGSHTEGWDNRTTGVYSHAEGKSTTVSGTYSHAEGFRSVVTGTYSHAEGVSTEAGSDGSHAEGFGTKADHGSHAEGSHTFASGYSSHAEGGSTIAGGQCTHAEGGSTSSSGDYSHAEGYHTNAKGNYQHVAGKYNIADTTSVEIIGNGTYENVRSNARRLDWSGNQWLAGKSVSVGVETTYISLNEIRSGNDTFVLPTKADHSLTYTITTTDDVASAKQEAIDSAATTAQAKVDALASAMHFENGAFTVIDAGTLNVDKLIATDTETINASIETQFFEFLHGNETSHLTSFVGNVYTKYDGVNDFFVGLNGDTLMLGDCATTRDQDGNITGISPMGLRTLAVRDYTPTFTHDDGYLVKYRKDGNSIIFSDSGFSPSQIQSDFAAITSTWDDMEEDWADIVADEATYEASERERFRKMPYPITMEQYDKIWDDGWYVNLLTDGSQTVTETPAEGARFSFAKQEDAVYTPVDDPEIREMIAACNEAQELIDSQVHVTPEQYAELEQQGLIDPDKDYFIEDNELYETLTVTIPAQEEQREENEQVRQDFLAFEIKKRQWPVSDADMVKLSANGVFGVHESNGNFIATVYDTQAQAEAAQETWIFPMQSDVIYPSED